MTAVIRIAVVAGLCGLAMAAPARADTFAVDRSDDADVAACTAAAGDCTLRGAMESALASPDPAATVKVPALHVLVDAPLPDTGKQAITISGAGTRKTKIDGHGVADTLFSGSMALKDLTVTGVRSDGPAVDAEGELDRVAIVGNHATGLIAPFTVVNDSLIAHNDGGQVGGIDGRSGLFLRNSTITDNTAHAPTGPANAPVVFTGGVLAGDGSSIENSTIAGNHVANDAPVITGLDLGSLSAVSLGAQLRSSVIGGSADRACGGLIVSAGHNVASDSSCHLDQAGDKPGVALKLGPLANNGGPTDTISLLAGSPAIDAGVSLAAGARKLGQRSLWIGGATRTVRLAPAHAPTRTRRLRLRVVAIDAAGNRSTRTLALRIR